MGCVGWNPGPGCVVVPSAYCGVAGADAPRTPCNGAPELELLHPAGDAARVPF
eukprot:CAMPEP_0204498448 /NCGR_PEP_ID=MMETSP0471-20130131/93026_1 /ASSEMBLY_ACC=CAM_ASM_000602 /TAXON_ID=2969 /ORGANISM="Oxyrrhis marina" /LENGTH=52 /DNA_ID=CAMNT_0051502913 /DNA_START=92 /DNA_END=247 /DNA_ORIENTATION=+